MMKKPILIVLLSLFCLAASAQANKDTIGLNLPIKDGRLIYTGVIDIAGKNKIELYKNAQQWFVDYFNSANAVLQNQDKEDGLIVGKGILKFNSSVGLGMVMPWGDNVTIKIECKDGRYRYSFYDMIIIYYYAYTEFPITQVYGKVLGTEKMSWTKNVAKNVLIHNNEKVQKAITSLKEAMNKTNSDF